MHTEYAYCVGRERKGKMPRLHSRRIHSEQRSFAFTVGERRLGGRRTWRRSGEQQHPARISAAATGDSGPYLRSGDRRLCRQGSSSSSAPRMAGPRPPRVGPPLLLLTLGMAVGGVEGGNGRRRRREVGADAAALGRCFAFLLAAAGGASVGAGGSHFFFLRRPSSCRGSSVHLVSEGGTADSL